MLECKNFYDQFNHCGVDFFTGVPDSLLKDFCAYISDHAQPASHIIAANEGSAIGLAIGHYLASGSPGLVYMQNSGQGNAVNPLTSLADNDVYGIPMLLLIGWRGEPGKKDEPQHVKQGKITIPMLDTMGIPFHILPESEAEAIEMLNKALSETKQLNQPVALVVPNGTFAPYQLQKKTANPYSMPRENAICTIVESLGQQDIIVSTTGKASRELYEYRKSQSTNHSPDFLTVGGMGHASQIALGIALSKPKRTVCCIDGDGAALMHLGGMGIIASSQAPNYYHVLLNNGVHDSVGGQPTIGFKVDFCAIARAVGYSHVYKAENQSELQNQLPKFLATKGPVFFEVCVSAGARDDLGRPKNSPAENKHNFMDHLRD